MPRDKNNNNDDDDQCSTLEGIDIGVPPAELFQQLLDKIVLQSEVLQTLKREVDEMRDRCVECREENDALRRQLREDGGGGLAARKMSSPSRSTSSSTDEQLAKYRRSIGDLELKLTECEATRDDLHEMIVQGAEEKEKSLRSMKDLVERYLGAFEDVSKEDFERLAKSILGFKKLMTRNIERMTEQQRALVDDAIKVVERYKGTTTAAAGGKMNFRELAAIEAVTFGKNNSKTGKHARLDNDDDAKLTFNKTFKIDENDNILVKNDGDYGFSETDLVIGDTFYSEELKTLRAEDKKNKRLQEFINDFERFRQQSSSTATNELQQQREQKVGDASLATPKSSVMINGKKMPLPPKKDTPSYSSFKPTVTSTKPRQSLAPKVTAASKIPTISHGVAKKKPATLGKVPTVADSSAKNLAPKKVELYRSVSSSTIVITSQDQAQSSTRSRLAPPRVVAGGSGVAPVKRDNTAVKSKLPTASLSSKTAAADVTKRDLVVKKSPAAQPIILMTKDDKSSKEISKILNSRLDKSKLEIVQVNSKGEVKPNADASQKDDSEPSSSEDSASIVKSMVRKINAVAEEKPEFLLSRDFMAKRKQSTIAAGQDNSTTAVPSPAEPSPFALHERKPVKRRLFSLEEDETDRFAVGQQQKQPSSFFYLVSR